MLLKEEKYKKVLVTGGTGFLGKNLQKVKPTWKYSNSSDCDLTKYQETFDWIVSEKPDAIIHLAAKVGGIKDNSLNPADFFDKNILMNTNIIKAAHNAGVNRVLSALSTCIFPEKVDVYPFSEESLLLGPPPSTNLSYGFAKRALHIQSCAYRTQHNRNYSTFCPSNIYGPYDNFDLETSHFIAALIRKVHERDIKTNNVEMWGTGKPKRQQLYVKDLARIVPILLSKHNSDTPLIIAPDENLSIEKSCNILANSINEQINFNFNNILDGQFRKDGSNTQLRKVIEDNFEFTSFSIGIRETYEWYKSSRRHNKSN